MIPNPASQRSLFSDKPTQASESGTGTVIENEAFSRICPNSLASSLEEQRWLLVKGDAYDLIGQLPADSVDLLITSPPYWGHRTYGQDHNWQILEAWKGESKTDGTVPSYDWYRCNGGILGLEPYPEWFILHLAEILDLAKQCLKETGSIWINLGDTYFARWSSIRENGRQGLGDSHRIRRRTPMGDYRQEKQLLLIPSRFAIEMQSRRWILRNDLIWHKPNVPPRPEKDRLKLSHEHFFHFVKRPREGRAKYYYELNQTEPAKNDVVTCTVKPGQPGHSATFPIDLVRPRIVSSCPPNGLVLDPFCGTGRALSAAVASGRRAIGFDVIEDFLLISQDLLKEQKIANE